MSEPIYSEILGRHYTSPTYEWTLMGNDLSTLVFHIGQMPSQATLDALWPEVEAQLAAEEALRIKERDFQAVYPIQTQQLIMARAQITGDHTDLNAMLAYWDSL